MNQPEVIEAFEMGEYITHPKNPEAIYEIMEVVEMHIDGQWVRGAAYRDIMKVGEIYVRPLDEFEKFELVF